ncbi:MAG: alpha/beta fold hydrolase [Bacteroidota bacterium]
MQLFQRKLGEQGPFLVILHGLFGSSDNWLTLGKRFAEDGFRVVLTDLRNHGLSPHSNEFDLATMASDVAELLDKLPSEKKFLMGHSLGGKVVMELIARNHYLLDGLVVVDIAPRAYNTRHKDVISALKSVNPNHLKNRKDVEEQLALTIHDFCIRQWLMKSLYWKEKDRLDWRFNLEVIAENMDVAVQSTEPTSPLSIPTLFLKGAKSDYINQQDETIINRFFTNARIETIPDAGHWLHAENPDATFEKAQDFLNALL